MALLGGRLAGQTLCLPPRPAEAPSGKAFMERITGLDLKAREQEIFAQITGGNIPDFLRKLAPITVTASRGGQTNTATFYVTPDYLAVGSDEDYVLTPMTPATAQRIAHRAQCGLPTVKMVNDIYAAAAVKLAPAPVPPSPAMTTVPVFAAHNAMVRTQRAAFFKSAPLGALVAGHKKDIVVTGQLEQTPGRVAIYGWHRTNGTPIQPLSTGHTAAWVDYSHGVRLVQQAVMVNGQPTTLAQALTTPDHAALFSDEGVILNPCYPTNEIPRPPPASSPDAGLTNTSPWRLADFQPSPYFDEQTLVFSLEPGVKVHVNAPGKSAFATHQNVLLVFCALPNGHTPAQTIGKARKPGDEWHYDMQHLGAQTRLLRKLVPDRLIVVAYLENDLKSWPAWRKQHGDALIPGLLDSVKRIFRDHEVRMVLAGHSGGGSFTFGFLNAVEAVPTDIERIAFLDSNYAYDTAQHLRKLVTWLKASDQHYLCVLAYHDAATLLDGKPFVRATGGTWGKSQTMMKDLETGFAFTTRADADPRIQSALHGRIQFILKENPERKILHTVQVDRNGFIQALLTGTPQEGRGYQYFGERAYSQWIQPE